jgi:hypothetical protein
MPVPSATGGSGQASSGDAAQIDRSVTPVKLSNAQRQQIRSYFAGKPANRTASVAFTISVGAAVPKQVQLQKLPPEVSAAMGGYTADDYIVAGSELIVVEPSARRIVAIVPNIT